MNLLQRVRTGLSRLCKGRSFLSLAEEGQAQFKLEEYEKARAVFLRLWKLVLGSKEETRTPGLLEYVLGMLAATWLVSEQYDEQIIFFSEQINRYGAVPAAYCGRASALWYSGQFQEAVDDYSRAIALRPTSMSALSSRGQVRAELGDHEEALKDLEQALQALQVLETTPGRAISDVAAQRRRQWEAFMRRGKAEALAGMGKTEQARDELDVSTTLCPENAWAFYSRAQLFETTGDGKKAAEDYQIALTKRGPALNLLRRERAQARLRDLLHHA